MEYKKGVFNSSVFQSEKFLGNFFFKEKIWKSKVLFPLQNKIFS